MQAMDYPECLVIESEVKDFSPWCETSAPVYVIMYCREGDAELRLMFRHHAFRQGMMAIIPPDMFPDFVSRSGTFRAFYWVMGRDFAEKALYDIPGSLYDAIYAAPILPVGDTMDKWMDLVQHVSRNHADTYRTPILSDLLHAFALDYYSKWRQHYDSMPVKEDKSPAEAICMKFYHLVSDHCMEHHTTAYYADRLCITPNYLAMITRQICNETPKQAIDRQIILGMKYMLRNTTMTAEQIALRLHFPDASYMCRFFRKHTGHTLSECRKMGIH